MGISMNITGYTTGYIVLKHVLDAGCKEALLFDLVWSEMGSLTNNMSSMSQSMNNGII